MRLENGFEVAAPADAAWRLLTDVPAVIPCMPGAQLVEVVDENAWKARLDVKLGPIALHFLADVTREQLDAAAGRIVLAVKAREARGRGNADATIEATLAPTAGGARVDIVTELALRGAVAQYGRGVVGDVASRLTAQFADCIADRLADEPSAATAAQPEPLHGLRLVLGALWRSLFRRRGQEIVR